MQIVYIIGALIVGAVLAVILTRKKSSEPEVGSTSNFQLMLSQLNELQRTVDQKLGDNERNVQDIIRSQFSESQRMIQNINEQMSKNLIEVAREQTKTNEATTRFITIADKLGDLEKTLKHQKQRGNWGEASLELILSNTLAPGQYKMQHEFKNREKVDAVIITKDGIIPIDAKFSLDNYDRVVHAIDDNQREVLEKEFKNDLKKRIDETAKYVRPEEGTLPFAFMYIPAEAIYYDLLINEVGSVKVNTRNLIDYAYNEKKVIVVSPTTFMAYLQSVLYGFKAFKIEEKTKDIIKNVQELNKHLNAYGEYHSKFGKQLQTLNNHYSDSETQFKLINKDITRISNTDDNLDPLIIGDSEIEQTTE